MRVGGMYGCGEQEVSVASGSMGVASGCGCKEVYRFPHTVISPTVKSREFYLRDDVTFPAKCLTFAEKNRRVKFVLAVSSLER